MFIAACPHTHINISAVVRAPPNNGYNIYYNIISVSWHISLGTVLPCSADLRYWSEQRKLDATAIVSPPGSQTCFIFMARLSEFRDLNEYPTVAAAAAAARVCRVFINFHRSPRVLFT